MIDHCAHEKEVIPMQVPQRKVKKLCCRRCTKREFWFNAQIVEYDMGNIILDIIFDVNMLPKKTRELMGKPKLVCSSISLWLSN